MKNLNIHNKAELILPVEQLFKSLLALLTFNEIILTLPFLFNSINLSQYCI